MDSTYSLLLLVVNLATETILIVDLVLQVEGVVLKSVASLNALTGSLVLLGVLLGLGNHAVDLLLGETTLVVGDGDGLGLASSLVVGGNLEDTVGIELEGDLNLRDTTGGGGDVGELELAEEVVVLGHRTLTLEDLDQDDGLVVGSSREDLALAGRDRSVAGNELSHDTTSGLNTKGEGVDIHENNVLSTLLVGEDTSLDGSTESDSLIGVDTLASLLASKELFEKSLNLGDTGGTTNEDDIVNLLLLQLGVIENLLDGLESALEEVHVELLELGTGKSLGEVVALEESLDLDTGGHLRRQSTLGLLCLTLELTHGLEVLGDVNAVLLVVGLGEVVDDALVEILTTKVSVTGSCQNLENTLVDGQQGHIEGTTTKIVDNDVALLVSLVKTVGNGGRSGLVNDTEDVETGNDTGVLGGLALSVVEVGGNGNNGVGDLLAQVRLGNLLHLAENDGRDFFGSEGLISTADLDLNNRLVVLVLDGEGEVLDIILEVLLVVLATNQTPVEWRKQQLVMCP